MSGEVVTKDHYQVCVRILECRNLAFSNMNPVVKVQVGKFSKYTRTCLSTDSPFFNEYFVFDFVTPLAELLDTPIIITVMHDPGKLRTQKVVGFFRLDVGTVRKQPEHQFYHKWAVLEDPEMLSDVCKGFLKCDLRAAGKGDTAAIPQVTGDEEDDDIEGNLLSLSESTPGDKIRALYEFSVFRGERISAFPQSPDKVSPYVSVSFAGCTAKTNVCKQTLEPEWNQSLVFRELMPPLWQRIKVQLINATTGKALASSYLDLGQLSYDGNNGFLPTFGPAFVNLYSRDYLFRGRILLSLRTSPVGDDDQAVGCTAESTSPLNETSLWNMEDVTLCSVILGAGCFPKKILHKQLYVHLAMGSNFWDSALESVSVPSVARSTTTALNLEGTRGPGYCSASIGVDKPCARIRAKWPDFRLRMYLSNALDVVVKSLEEYVTFLRKQRDNGEEDLNIPFIMAAEEIQKNCSNFLAREYYPLYTQLDAKRYQLRRMHVEAVRKAAKAWQKDNITFWGMPKRLDEAEGLLTTLKELVQEPQDSLPDVMISLMLNGQKMHGYVRKPARHFVYSTNSNEVGPLCGKITTFLLKHESNPTIFPGSVTLLTWICYDSDYDACMALLPPGFIAQGGGQKMPPQAFTCLHTQEFLGKVYIYQGRFVPGSDTSGLADPFVRVTLNGQTCETKVVNKTLNPTWDQTLTFRRVSLSTSWAKYYKKYPPQIIVEVFDKDKFDDDLIGRTTLQPLVKLFDELDVPMLAWLPVFNGSSYAGDLLIAAELIQQRPEDLTRTSEEQLEQFSTLPNHIKPNLTTYRIEVLFWGVRDLKRVKLLTVTKPQAILEMNGVEIASNVIANATKNPNFTDPLSSLTLKLPEELEYLPPASITVVDRRRFGQTVLVGSHVLSNLASVTCSHHPGKTPIRSVASNSTNLTRSRKMKGRSLGKRLRPSIHWFRTADSDSEYSRKTDGDSESEASWSGPKKASKRLMKKKLKIKEPETADPEPENIDWWMKFYAATKENVSVDKTEEGYENKRVRSRIKVYPAELEKQPEFRGFQDRLKTFPLYKGKREPGSVYDEKNVVGRIKMSLCLYRTPTPDYHRELILSHGPSNLPLNVVARVYCVRAFGLHARDPTGYSDPYVEVCVGDKKVGRRDDYVPRQLDPVFGQMLEVEMMLPLETQLTVRVMDWDAVSSDDLIGETVIDVEDRLYSKHRATCGLSTRYDEFGYNEWRDVDAPTQILRTLCRRYNYANPVYLKGGAEVTFGPYRFQQTNAHPFADLKEQCALAALHTWLEPLVPEHVETRSLYRPDLPGLEQGKLQMWVDLFVPRLHHLQEIKLPPPVDISPRLSSRMELRMIVWNTADVILDEYDIIYGARSSDIYVKAWMAGAEKAVQSTDVHYRSMDGEGNFNWRMIFPLQLLPLEERLVVSNMESFFARRGTKRSVPPRLYLQVWDCDHFSPDDFLGELSLNLRRFPKGAPTARACTMKVMTKAKSHLNLFKVRKTRGWWPVMGFDGEKMVLTGKVDLQMEVLAQEEADKSPAGRGRDPPQALDMPVRPDSSFFWLRNPLSALKHLAFRRSRRYMLMMLLVVLTVFFVLTALYSMPGYTVKKFIGA